MQGVASFFTKHDFTLFVFKGLYFTGVPVVKSISLWSHQQCLYSVVYFPLDLYSAMIILHQAHIPPGLLSIRAHTKRCNEHFLWRWNHTCYPFAFRADKRFLNTPDSSVPPFQLPAIVFPNRPQRNSFTYPYRFNVWNGCNPIVRKGIALLLAIQLLFSYRE